MLPQQLFMRMPQLFGYLNYHTYGGGIIDPHPLFYKK